jgi:hypothetical protein
MRQDFFQFSYLRNHMRTENGFLLRIQRKKKSDYRYISVIKMSKFYSTKMVDAPRNF